MNGLKYQSKFLLINDFLMNTGMVARENKNRKYSICCTVFCLKINNALQYLATNIGKQNSKITGVFIYGKV